MSMCSRSIKTGGKTP